MDALEKLGVSYDVLHGIMDAEKNFPMAVMTAVTRLSHPAGMCRDHLQQALQATQAPVRTL